MGFRIGFLLGLIMGGVYALLFAPYRGEEARQRLGAALAGQEEEEGRPPGEHDPLAHLSQALRSLRRQAQEAWKQAREAAKEAEEEMRERYEATLRRPRRRR